MLATPPHRPGAVQPPSGPHPAVPPASSARMPAAAPASGQTQPHVVPAPAPRVASDPAPALRVAPPPAPAPRVATMLHMGAPVINTLMSAANVAEGIAFGVTLTPPAPGPVTAAIAD